MANMDKSVEGCIVISGYGLLGCCLPLNYTMALSESQLLVTEY